MNSSLSVFLQSANRQDQTNRIYGVVTGVVTNNEDPEESMRVRVKFPWLSAEEESFWARICAPMSPMANSANELPPVGSEVLVAFNHGDIRFPFILGILLPRLEQT